MDLLRKFIRAVISESDDDKKDKKSKHLLTEPDDPDTHGDRSPEEEMSVVASIAGVTTPLGTGPTYPDGGNKKKKKKKKFRAGWQKSGPVT